ncbi:MAG: cell division transport system permease protein [Methylobacteriaceae bacterium]|nr:cell division transport system permease protein [Methylobacteriaceae bacterium]
MTVLMSHAGRRNRQADPRDADRDAIGSEAAPLRREMPLVPAASIAGRSLVTVIAIMTFLASLAAGTAILVTEASRGWQSSVTREATIQVRPVAGRDLDAETRKAADIAARAPGVADVRTFSAAESARLLEPWLGNGLDLGELPVPRMIVVKKGPGAFDAAALRRALAADVPAASFDDHSQWLSRLSVMTRTVVGAAIVLFGLVLTAMLLAVAFATRGAMAGNREIIDVLHFVGAEDRFIAREFQRHFLRLGLRGGLIGAGAAALTFFVLGRLAPYWTATASGDQIEALFGGFSLGLPGYFAIAAIWIGIALLTGLISRTIVFRHLRELN